MSLPNCGPAPRYLENLRIGGGYGTTPNGGTDLDHAGNAAFSGDLTLAGNLAALGDLTYQGIHRADTANGGVNRDWHTELKLFGDEVNSGASGPTSVSHSSRMFYKAWDFSPTVLQALNSSFMLPMDYDGTPLRVRLVWTSQAAKGGTSGNVKWRVYLRAYDHGDAYAISATWSDTLDTFLGVDKFHITDIVHQPESPGKGLPLSINIRRVADDAADTFNADAQLLKVLISYA